MTRRSPVRLRSMAATGLRARERVQEISRAGRPVTDKQIGPPPGRRSAEAQKSAALPPASIVAMMSRRMSVDALKRRRRPSVSCSHASAR